MLRVYLAGPISGLSLEECVSWRQAVSEACADMEIEFFSPLRGKAYLQGIKSIDPIVQMDAVKYPLSTTKGIITRDHFDVNRADVLFVNFLGAKRVSIGTIAEMAWAYAQHKPIITVMDTDNPHQHAFVREMSGFILPDLPGGIQVLRSIV